MNASSFLRLAAGLWLAAGTVLAQSTVGRAVFPGGGGTSTAGPDAVTGTVGRHDGRTFNAVVPRVTPVITWANPADLPHGTPLGAAQLNATADVPGTFAYTPPGGTVLPLGSGQELAVLFTPDQPALHAGATATVFINVINAAPVAGADRLVRPNNTRVAKVLKSVLLGNDSDPDLDPLSLTAVGNALPVGATVALSGSFVVYTAPANSAGDGSFTYTLSDGPGGHTLLVTVPVTEVTPGGGSSGPNAQSIVASGADFIVTFIGVPGGGYRVQYTTGFAAPYTWNEFNPPATYTAAPNGVFSHTDIAPPGPERYYRAVKNP